MNRYGRLALDHNRRHRPQAYAQIQDPDPFFTSVGMSIEADVTTARDRILGPQRADENAEDYRLRSYQALAVAEELTLADHPLLQVEEHRDPTVDDPMFEVPRRQLAEINEAINAPW